jgi:threonine dehydrogenase-like Zn-dependent dehydrogenase
LTKNGGASRVAVSEPQENRRRAARANGADCVVDPSVQDDPVKALRDATDGGADLVIECVGRPETAEQAVHAAIRGGTVLLFGVADEAALAKISPYEVFFRELTIAGSFINPFTHSRAIEALETGRFDPSKIISHRYAVEEFGAALEMSRSRDAMKVVVQPQSQGS